MKVSTRQIIYIGLITLLISSGTALQAQTGAYRTSDRQVQTLLTRIVNRTNTLRDQVDRALDNSNIDGTRREDNINSLVVDFVDATNRLTDNFASRRSTGNDVQEVLRRAAFINSFMRNNRMSAGAQSTWTLIRTDLNTLASYYRVTPNWTVVTPSAQNVYIGSNTQIRTLLNTVESRTYTFKRQISRNLNNSNVDGTSREESINAMVANFETATNRLKTNFSSRRSSAADVQEVLNRAVQVNRFVLNNNLSPAAENSWSLIRTDLDTLAGYYRVNTAWNNNNNNTNTGGQYRDFDSRLTGTYRLNSSQSDDISTIVDRAIASANYSTNLRDRMRRNLERRLVSPETLAYEKRGQQVTMGSSNAAPVTLHADGVKQTETSPNGRTVTSSVTATNRDLTISYEGDRMNDYNVVFTPMNNGQLKVTRRIYLENQSTTVTASSIYDKTSPTPDWNIATNQTYPVDRPVNGFIIPNNTIMTATLDSPISTRTAVDGDRFSMTVTSPSQFSGAVIEGSVVGQKSGVVSGRATMSLNFNTIRMRNGQIYTFAGIVDQVRNMNGDVINVNNEGQIRDSSQTNKTVTRAGIGAVLGAIIGAIAGGGSGAAIGAGVGAGAGAGTVVLQGRDNLELASGSQFNITATAPSNVGIR